MKKQIGHRIKELRIIKLHINQNEFAKILGFDRTYLSRIESGKQNITVDTLNYICAKLEISLADFFKPFVSVE